MKYLTITQCLRDHSGPYSSRIILEHIVQACFYPDSRQDRVNFCSSQKGHSQNPEVFLYHLISFPKAGVKGVSSEEKRLLPVK